MTSLPHLRPQDIGTPDPPVNAEDEVTPQPEWRWSPSDLKVGDECAARLGGHGRPMRIGKVTKRSPSRVTVEFPVHGTRSFLTSTGKLFGERGVYACYLVAATAERRAESDEQLARENALNALHRTVWDRLSTEALVAVAAILTGGK